MTYASQQNLIDRFGEQELIELTDHAQTGAINATVLGQALADADAEINAYLTSRYTLPLASVPPILVKFAADVAYYQFFDARVPEQVEKHYENAIKFLRLLASGAVSLGLDPANQPVADVGGVQVNAPDRVFDADSLAGY